MSVGKKKKVLKGWTMKASDDFRHDIAIAARLTERTSSSFVRNAVIEELRRISAERPELAKRFKLLAA